MNISEQVEILKARKKELRDLQANLSLKEKIEILDRLQQHYLWILEHPAKEINKTE